MNGFAERLVTAGMTPAEAAPKGEMFDRAARALPDCSEKDQELLAFYVPGRIEVLGKHTDYAGGRSLLCAVERGFCLAVRPRRDSVVLVTNARSHARCMLILDPEIPDTGAQWCAYPSASVRRLARNFPFARRGADIAFISDLPAASGMSSSSAFVVAVFLALADINGIAGSDLYRCEIESKEDLAGYLGTVENGQSFGTLLGDRGVGTFGGSEDHTAILCSQAARLKQYSFCPIRHERTVDLPEDLTFVIGVSGVIAMKTGAALAKYNHAALTAGKVLEIWRTATGRNDVSLAAALAASQDAPDRMREALRISEEEEFPASLLCSRLTQFEEESNVIIPAATDALARSDFAAFGALVDRSQQGAERLLGNQVPETVALAWSARMLGAVAASAFGAGFGGSVWALVPAAGAAEFERRWNSRFLDQFPSAEHARFFITRPGPAALRL